MLNGVDRYEDPLARGIRMICEAEGATFGWARLGASGGIEFVADGRLYAVDGWLVHRARTGDAKPLGDAIAQMIGDSRLEQRYRDRPKPRLGMGTRGYKPRCRHA